MVVTFFDTHLSPCPAPSLEGGTKAHPSCARVLSYCAGVVCDVPAPTTSAVGWKEIRWATAEVRLRDDDACGCRALFSFLLFFFFLSPLSLLCAGHKRGVSPKQPSGARVLLLLFLLFSFFEAGILPACTERLVDDDDDGGDVVVTPSSLV